MVTHGRSFTQGKRVDILRRVLLSPLIGVQLVRLYSTWHYPLLDVLGTVQGEYVLRTRTGNLFRCRPRTDDWFAVTEMWGACPYLTPTLSGILARCPCALDVGAHIGSFSILLTKLHNRMIVHAFEPASSNFRLLSENIELNSLRGRVVPYRRALGRETGRRTLYVNPRSTQGHSTVAEMNGSGVEEVMALSLDDALEVSQLKNCGLLKLDCEGSEYEVLLGSSDSCLRRFKALAVEFHDVTGFNVHMMIDRLTWAGFHIQLVERLATIDWRTGNVLYSARVLLATSPG